MGEQTEGVETRLMTVVVKQDLRVRFKALAARKDVTMQDAVEQALTVWCDKAEAELESAA